MHWVSAYVAWIPLAVICGLSFYFGSEAISKVLASIPAFITTGISAATGMLPALGLALLAKFLNNKKLEPFFFIGFLAVALFNSSILGIACIAVCVALLIVFNEKDNNMEMNVKGDDDNEF